jgi:Mrp family chromosome partitioning ATPase
MAVFSRELDDLREDVASGDPAGAPTSDDRSAPGTSLLPTSPSRHELTTRPQREWILPGANEYFRRIYARAVGGRSEILAVSSAIAGEGKTTLCLGLGVTIAEDLPERRVLVVETNPQRPALAEDFGLDPSPGLLDCLVDEEPIELSYRRTLLDNLHVVPIGGPVPNPGRLLRSSAMAMAVDSMRATHDLVILDVPAVLEDSSAVLLADLADSVLLVVRVGATPVSLVSKALGDIDADRLRGVVLNELHSAIPAGLRRLFGT